MSNRALTEYRYEKLTWPEINDAVDLGKVCIVPCGAVEQHGPHLPLDVDLVCPDGHRPRRRPRACPTRCWCCRSWPTATPATSWIFPARSTTTSSTSCTTCSTSPSRWPITASRRSSCSTATARTCRTSTWWPGAPTWRPTPSASLAAWWNLLTVDKDVPAALAAEQVPRRLRHACELETSLYLYLDGDNVRKDQIKNGIDQLQRGKQPVQLGRPVRGRPGHGDLLDQQLLRDRRAGRSGAGHRREGHGKPTRKRSSSWRRFVTWFKDRPIDARRDRHRHKPTMPIPWGQRPAK